MRATKNWPGVISKIIIYKMMDMNKYDFIENEIEKLFPGAAFTLEENQVVLYVEIGGNHKNKKKRKCEIILVINMECNPPELALDSLQISTKLAFSKSYTNIKDELRRLANECLNQRVDDGRKLINEANEDHDKFMDFID